MSVIEKARDFARVAGLTTGLVALGGIGITYAAPGNVTVSGGNNLTGASSSNINTTSATSSDFLSVNNFATAMNSFHAMVNTGDNNVSQNTTAGGFMGGSVNLAGSFSSNLNSGAATIPAGSGVGGSATVNFTNGTTGANSSNVNTVSLHNTSSTNIHNTAVISNNFMLNANTGDNNISQNTTAGSGIGGNVTANIVVSNTANQGAAAGAAMAGQGAGAVVAVSGSNTITGSGSENTNVVNVSNLNMTNVMNTSTVTNNFGVTANTGDNNASQNTTVGAISSGNVNLNFTVSNSGN